MAEVNLIVKETLNITCMKNDTFKLDMDWTDSDDAAIDLTAYTFKAEVRRSPINKTSVISFSDSDFTKDANGNLLMKKAASAMNVASGIYYYDLQATHTSSGDVSTWLGGTLEVKEDVTE